jgi:hypothetical protein
MTGNVLPMRPPVPLDPDDEYGPDLGRYEPDFEPTFYSEPEHDSRHR